MNTKLKGERHVQLAEVLDLYEQTRAITKIKKIEVLKPR